MNDPRSVDVSPDQAGREEWMSDDSYTKNEINLMLVPIHDKLESIAKQQCASFETVIAKQDKTNGRVKSLELWKARFAGGLAVLCALLVPVVLYIVKLWIEAFA